MHKISIVEQFIIKKILLQRSIYHQIIMDSFNNDIVIRFASYLSSQDLVNLSLTCRKFGGSQLHDGESSLMEDTAHQIMCDANEDEKEALPKLADQTYIELYSELEKLREPRVFDQLIGERISYVDNDKSHIKYNKKERNYIRTDTAISNHVMRAGKHYVTFVIGGTNIHFAQVGIVRPLKNWDKKGLECFDPMDRDHYDELQQERTERWGESNVHSCRLTVGGFNNIVSSCSWNHSYVTEHLRERENEVFTSGDRIGMLLDLDFGTLCVYRNDCRVGVMASGLSGEYCWCGVMITPGPDIHIEKGSIPID